jgi:hypothetical protein
MAKKRRRRRDLTPGNSGNQALAVHYESAIYQRKY